MPRSGSTWLSNFLTYNGSFCAHDPLFDFSPEELQAEILGRNYEVSGAIDTGAILLPKDYFPEARKFLLVRDEFTARDSLYRNNLAWIPMRQRVLEMGDYPVFEYERLFNLDYLKRLWDEVTGLPFDESRTKALLEMRINMDFTRIHQRIE